jgi:Flp pilus assembly protein TadD
VGDAMKRDMQTCPDPETLAAFIDGKLTGREREEVVAHLADCADCYFVFSELARVPVARDLTGARGFSRAWFTQPRVLWPSVAALATAAALAIAVGTGIVPLRSSQAELQALVAAVGTERTFEPRLTGGFAYGPVKATRGTATEAPPEVRIAAAEIEKASSARRTPANLDALGIANLVVGKPAEAVTALESATRDEPNNAAYWSDLSAAYLVRASRSNQPDDFAKALTFADRAVKTDPRLAEAWFNRAVAVTHLSSAAEARHAWEDFLRVDASSPWATEARAHLSSLENSGR